MIRSERIGVVVIGRNEGERLERCLASLPEPAAAVYVDSGSSDGSVAMARAAGVAVVELDATLPFTAARARNAGLDAMMRLAFPPDLIQMLDGDCTLDEGWLAAGARALAADPGVAVVFGRRRERDPAKSLYNRLCDDEWNVPVGAANACGGDALFRAGPLAEAGGYAPDLIAGEEPDLCLRLRGAGWRIRRIDAEMTLHDAGMTRFGQYWRRMERAGHAFAELAWRHGAAGDPAWRRAVLRALFWAVALPLGLAIGLAFGLVPVVAVLLLLYPLQALRLAMKRRMAGADFAHAIGWGALLVIGKFAEAIGIARFHLLRLRRRRSELIEYKDAHRHKATSP